jgi:hypothetical protein
LTILVLVTTLLSGALTAVAVCLQHDGPCLENEVASFLCWFADGCSCRHVDVDSPGRFLTFGGVCIGKYGGKQLMSSFRLRNMIDGVGVEYVFPINAPHIKVVFFILWSLTWFGRIVFPSFMMRSSS